MLSRLLLAAMKWTPKAPVPALHIASVTSLISLVATSELSCECQMWGNIVTRVPGDQHTSANISCLFSVNCMKVTVMITVNGTLYEESAWCMMWIWRSARSKVCPYPGSINHGDTWHGQYSHHRHKHPQHFSYVGYFDMLWVSSVLC